MATESTEGKIEKLWVCELHTDVLFSISINVNNEIVSCLTMAATSSTLKQRIEKSTHKYSEKADEKFSSLYYVNVQHIRLGLYTLRVEQPCQQK